MAEEGSPQWHAPPGIARVTAPILFGPMINWALCPTNSRVDVYSYNFVDDKRLLKTLVYFIFLLETVQTALTGVDVYYWFIVGFGDPEGLKKSRFSPIDVPTMDGLISVIVQLFFCYRIWTLSKRLWWFCIVIVVSAALGRFAVIKPSLYLWLITSAVVDILIAVTMTFLLRRRRDNENRCSRDVLPRIARLTVETNTLTATVAIVSFALYIGFPNDIYYACPYSNTLLVTLNNRIYFRDHLSPRGSGPGIGPPGHSSHNLPQVRPPGIARTNDTITLDSFSSTTDLEKAKNNDNFAVSNLRPSF
ncbi:hypothetical protein F5888DRAFT_1638428 [Russula emetica]|nr:hypothetical protein F5888DRAFT_1638428 [Russula emetica]